MRRAIDSVIDTPNTGRWDRNQCDPVEQAYLGFRVENLVRGIWELPRGQHGMDFDIDGVDVDCKWSKFWSGWQIPREAVNHICLLIWGADATNELAVGLLRTHEEMLVGGNQDKKRGIQRPQGRARAVWVVPRSRCLPPNFLYHLPSADREAILGKAAAEGRAIELFRRCVGVVIPRHAIDQIGQQIDNARRARAVKTVLLAEGLEILNGTWLEHRARATELGGPVPGPGEWVALPSRGMISGASVSGVDP